MKNPGFIVFTVPHVSKPAKHQTIQLQAVMTGLDYSTVPKPMNNKSAFAHAVVDFAKEQELKATRVKHLKNYVQYILTADKTRIELSWDQGEIKGGPEPVKHVRLKMLQLEDTIEEHAWGRAITSFFDSHGLVPVRPDGRVWWCPNEAMQSADLQAFSRVLLKAGIKLVAKPVDEHDLDWLPWKIYRYTRKQLKQFNAELDELKELTGKYLSRRENQLLVYAWACRWHARNTNDTENTRLLNAIWGKAHKTITMFKEGK